MPMIIASPWSRGGFVNSEVFDHTSSIQFVEHFLAKKYNKKVHEENVTQWRRTICGDLTSVFRPYNGEKITRPGFLEKKPFYESIHQAQFLQVPNNYKKLTAEEIAVINKDHTQSPHFPQQEKGVRPANALRYELYTHGEIDKQKNTFGLAFTAGNKVYGNKAAGSPFRVYSVNPYQKEELRAWDYSAAAGDTLRDEWNLADFENGLYHLKVYGPNGFYREFTGNRENPLLKITCNYQRNRINAAKLTGNVAVTIANHDSKPHLVTIEDKSYKTGSQQKAIAAGAEETIVLNLEKSHQWYDFGVSVKGHDAFAERFAGHVENGEISKTDPLMGGVV